MLAVYMFLLSLTLSLTLTPIAASLGRRWGVLDHPGARKIHSNPIPLTGGWAIFTTLSLVLWGHIGIALILRSTELVSGLPHLLKVYVGASPALALRVLPVWLGALAIFILGVLDDVRGLSVKKRLLCQFGVAMALATHDYWPSLNALHSWLAVAVGVIWIVGITNAFNLMDGLDGLSTGVSLVATMALMAIMVIGSQPGVTCYLAALAGIQIGFLRFNFNPARTFLGSSGALLLGYLMAMSTLLVNYHHEYRTGMMTIITPVLILAIPIYDTCSVVLIRLFKKRSIVEGDQNHFHHRLRRLGFSHRQAVLFIWLVAFSVGLSAVGLIGASFERSLLILLQIVGILSLIIIAERVAENVRRKILERPSRNRRSTDPKPATPKTDVQIPPTDIDVPKTDVMSEPVGSGDSN
jgi:UDP-GlcNAc:undecaprenyl-phosphate/decaprenyl-phosphate GlcNAc-1-phosphate transferase